MRPRSIDGGVAHTGYIEAVGDHGVALLHGIISVKSADVALVIIGCIGDVYYQWGDGGSVAAVAAEECRFVIQAQVYERVDVRDAGEGCTVCDS